MAVRKSLSQVRNDLLEAMDTSGQYFLNKVPADLGNHAGVVKVPNTQSMVYARLTNGQVVEVFNDKAPAIRNWKVFIGRDKSQPGVLKVLEVRWVYNMAQTVAYVLFHHQQHEFPAPDTVWIYRDQFMPLLVLPNGGFHVRLYGDLIYSITMTNPIRLANIPDIDLSSYVVSTGANYVLMEVDPSGSLNYVVGGTYGSLDILRASAPFPTPTEGSFPICVIEFYEGQTEIRRDSTVRNIIDLRMFTSNVSIGTGSQIHTSPFGTPVSADEFGYWNVTSNRLEKLTLLSFEHKLQDDGFRGEVLMASGLSDPLVPLDASDGSGWVYSSL